MIVERRKPGIETEPVDWVAIYDQELKNNLDHGMEDRDAEAAAFATCSMLWLQQNPIHSDYLVMSNRGVCSYCCEGGADKPLPVLGIGVSVHKKTCLPATSRLLSVLACAGLAADGLVVLPDAAEPTFWPEPEFKPYVPA